MKRPARFLAMMTLSLLLASAVGAATILDSGPGFFVIEYPAGHGEAGSVSMLVEIIDNGRTSQGFQVQSSIDAIHVESGWTYEVKKWGGLNSAIEVLFLSNTGCEVKFKAVHVPGKTEVDAGTPKC